MPEPQFPRFPSRTCVNASAHCSRPSCRPCSRSCEFRISAAICTVPENVRNFSVRLFTSFSQYTWIVGYRTISPSSARSAATFCARIGTCDAAASLPCPPSCRFPRLALTPLADESSRTTAAAAWLPIPAISSSLNYARYRPQIIPCLPRPRCPPRRAEHSRLDPGHSRLQHLRVLQRQVVRIRSGVHVPSRPRAWSRTRFHQERAAGNRHPRRFRRRAFFSHHVHPRYGREVRPVRQVAAGPGLRRHHARRRRHRHRRVDDAESRLPQLLVCLLGHSVKLVPLSPVTVVELAVVRIAVHHLQGAVCVPELQCGCHYHRTQVRPGRHPEPLTVICVRRQQRGEFQTQVDLCQIQLLRYIDSLHVGHVEEL